MKKAIKVTALAFAMGMMLTSCYTYTTVVGKGAQGSTEVKKWNTYVIYGLIPAGVSDAKEMAGGATDYTVTVKHSFVNGLLAGITFGIYTPTTTIVTK
ncbi:hypothetical protein FMM05_13815 [Flavobacterium zepuense]|uniref:Bor protein n=1 Tax=Flavobacterium zepuense TaxID=2593302 RepID=A0A552UYK2_9FLAO|nr:Bor family protein [Flavobacterium zepuense]TRW23271.1 hypothetical protein FMM05_13815 [Flavobacterium zepuense]